MAPAPSPSPDVEGVAIGSLLDGRYRIDAVLGTGGMGRVYRGEHTGIGRAVAIKVLHADLSRNRDAAQRFQREALASGRLEHPNIVGVSDFGMLDDGACYLVMEMLEGEPLGARLERERRIEWPEALDIMRGVLAGLKHAHDKGVVHRDIKPDNIFLAVKEGELIVKILDFGIAKLYAGTADDPASTRAGLTVGTPAYLSPEQAVGGDITPASDLYSATILLFEMIAGRTPFVEKEPLAMLGAHVSRLPPKLAEVAPDLDLPPGLEEVIARGLAKSAVERFTNARELIGALDAVSAGVPLQSGVREDVGLMRTSSLTPVPAAPDQSVMIEVVPGTSTPVPGRYVMRTPSTATPVVGSPAIGSAPIAAAAPTLDVERPLRAVSLSDVNLPPLPKRWYKIAGVVVGVGIVLAIALLIASDGSKKRAEHPIVTAPVVMPVPVIDREKELKALLHDLQTGKTCAERKAAIPKLVILGDERAIEPLRKARYRMVGGVLGIGDSNANHCLKAEAEAAIRKLSGK